MKQDTKCPFFKMILMCFPILKKKPSPEQKEIIDTVNEGIDQLQDIINDNINDNDKSN